MLLCSDLEQDYVIRKAIPDAGKVLQTRFLRVKKNLSLVSRSTISKAVHCPFPLNKPAEILKIRNLARNRENALVAEAIDGLGFFQQMEKEWMVEIQDGDHKPRLLFLLVPNINSHRALGNVIGKILSFLFLSPLHKATFPPRQMAADMPFSSSQKIQAIARGFNSTFTQTLNPFKPRD